MFGSGVFFAPGEAFFPRTGAEGLNVAGDEGFKPGLGLEVLQNMGRLVCGNIF
jgi:hypothetical protein